MCLFMYVCTVHMLFKEVQALQLASNHLENEDGHVMRMKMDTCAGRVGRGQYTPIH
jgi:hypothetical protein